MQIASIFASTDIEQRAIRPEVSRTGRTGARRNPMITMAPPRPAERHDRQERHRRQERRERHGCLVRLATGPAAAGEARRRVRDAVRSWRVPVDLEVALLLTSELVTNAVQHETGHKAQAVVLAIACSRGRLRVDVHDTSRSLPAMAEADADAYAETGRGLLLVETLSDEWGFYRTPAGKAVYFTLAFETDQADETDRAGQPDEAPAAGGRGPQRVHARGRWTVTPPSEYRPRRAALAVPAARLPSA
jgi:anti-sigma regulatory factor (Ser/Thr protein kinase)